jgi:hypothetical protein
VAAIQERGEQRQRAGDAAAALRERERRLLVREQLGERSRACVDERASRPPAASVTRAPAGC